MFNKKDGAVGFINWACLRDVFYYYADISNNKTSQLVGTDAYEYV